MVLGCENSCDKHTCWALELGQYYNYFFYWINIKYFFIKTKILNFIYIINKFLYIYINIINLNKYKNIKLFNFKYKIFNTNFNLFNIKKNNKFLKNLF